MAPGECQIPVYHSNEETWEALAFPKLYFNGERYFNSYRDVRLTPSKYAHATHIVSVTKNIFHCLDCVEEGAVSSSINTALRKHFQGDITAGQVNSGNVLRWISDIQLFATFKNSFVAYSSLPNCRGRVNYRIGDFFRSLQFISTHPPI